MWSMSVCVGVANCCLYPICRERGLAISWVVGNMASLGHRAAGLGRKRRFWRPFGAPRAHAAGPRRGAVRSNKGPGRNKASANTVLACTRVPTHTRGGWLGWPGRPSIAQGPAWGARRALQRQRSMSQFTSLHGGQVRAGRAGRAGRVAARGGAVLGVRGAPCVALRALMNAQ